MVIFNTGSTEGAILNGIFVQLTEETMATSRKKDLSCHKTAEACLTHNRKPAQVAKVSKDIFPLANVNGRHIGAY